MWWSPLWEHEASIQLCDVRPSTGWGDRLERGSMNRARCFMLADTLRRRTNTWQHFSGDKPAGWRTHTRSCEGADCQAGEERRNNSAVHWESPPFISSHEISALARRPPQNRKKKEKKEKRQEPQTMLTLTLELRQPSHGFAEGSVTRRCPFVSLCLPASVWDEGRRPTRARC